MTPRAATTVRFRLFVAGESPNSLQAVANLRALCDADLAGRHEVEIVDLMQTPERALEENILLTPTLVKVAPGPVLRIVGALTDRDVLRRALSLSAGSKSR